MNNTVWSIKDAWSIYEQFDLDKNIIKYESSDEIDIKMALNLLEAQRHQQSVIISFNQTTENAENYEAYKTLLSYMFKDNVKNEDQKLPLSIITKNSDDKGLLYSDSALVNNFLLLASEKCKIVEKINFILLNPVSYDQDSVLLGTILSNKEKYKKILFSEMNKPKELVDDEIVDYIAYNNCIKISLVDKRTLFYFHCTDRRWAKKYSHYVENIKKLHEIAQVELDNGKKKKVEEFEEFTKSKKALIWDIKTGFWDIKTGFENMAKNSIKGFENIAKNQKNITTAFENMAKNQKNITTAFENMAKNQKNITTAFENMTDSINNLVRENEIRKNQK